MNINNYRLNSVLTGVFYLLGTLFGILSVALGGEVLASMVSINPLDSQKLMDLIVIEQTQLTTGAFLVFMMGISLTLMTVVLFPLIRKDSEELAYGMLLFRGALEGTFYIIATLSIMILVNLGQEYISLGTDQEALRSLGKVIYGFQSFVGPVGTMMFLIGTTCLYISFYRTQLIPRWLTVWGLIGVVPYFAYVFLQFFQIESEVKLYLQMILAPQEIVMGVWLIVKGFNPVKLKMLIDH